MDAHQVIERYRSLWGTPPDLLVRAPGRVNLIGDHTDHQEGHVFPFALPVATWIAVAVRDDHRSVLTSEAHGPIDIADDRPADGWGRYVHATREILAEEGLGWAGTEGLVMSDIPDGASLSSSAALEVALLLVQRELTGFAADAERIARLAQRVEHRAVGLPSGIMDQLISARATEGCVQLIDCRDLSWTDHRLPRGVTVVVLDSKTRRELADSAYGDRRAGAERVAAAAGHALLRDVAAEQLADLDVDPVDRRRAEHVLAEDARTVAAAAALSDGRVEEVGRLMTASHESLRDLYEVTGPALDANVDASLAAPGCLGARMTGGGFAGCTVALVRDEAVDDFVTAQADAVERSGFPRPVRVPATPSAGASVIPL